MSQFWKLINKSGAVHTHNDKEVAEDCQKRNPNSVVSESGTFLKPKTVKEVLEILSKEAPNTQIVVGAEDTFHALLRVNRKNSCGLPYLEFDWNSSE